jgi:hypothetical protein
MVVGTSGSLISGKAQPEPIRAAAWITADASSARTSGISVGLRRMQ